MLYRVNLDSSSDDIVKNMSESEYAALRQIVIQLPAQQSQFWYWNDMVVDTDGIASLLAYGVQVNIKQIKNTYSPQTPPGGWTRLVDEAKSAVHVHIPNIGLLNMRHVMVLEDACTNELQIKLDEGWRIIAICPPNGVRRPDYILGRADPELAV